MSQHIESEPEARKTLETTPQNDAYLQNRSTYYDQEKRWVTRPFWKRRCRVQEVMAAD